MEAELHRYPAYKDSGAPSLAGVPEHWEGRKLRHILRPIAVRNRPDLPLLSVVREKGVILRDVTSQNENRNFIPDDLTNYKVVRVGQFAMNKMKAWQGSYGVSSFDGIVSPAYFVFDLSGVSGSYLHTAIRSRAYVPFFTQASDGVRIGQWDLSHTRMREIPFFVPPLSEQTAIVRFLDHVDRRIRRYIRAKQKLIKLLEEQKQAIIHRAVTRGLDPNVRLKPSGVEWLVDVPEHWELTSIGVICTYISYGFTNPMPVADNGPYMLTANDIGDGMIRYETARRTTQHAFDHLLTKKSRPIRGDLLVTKDGTLGRVAVSDGNTACINQSVAILRTQPDLIDPNYLSLVLRSPLYQERMIFEAGGTTIKHIYITRLAKMKVAYPSIEEQRRILQSLRNEIVNIERAVTKAQTEISLFREYRTRLIADVVTGKLDVREAAARLPDEVEEPETVEEVEERLEGEEENGAEGPEGDAEEAIDAG